MSDYSVLGAEDDNESMCSISEVQRNLFPEFDQEVQKDYLEVFLRIKPTTRDEQDDQKYLDVESEQAVVVHPLRDPVVPPPAPAGAGMGCGAARGRQQGAGLKLPAAVSAFQNNNQQQSMKFTFSKVFDESTNQKIFFDEAVQSTVREFLDGQNCLLFAYGVTNSGKTYTMQGTPSDAGVVPRTFDVIFNSIGDRLYGRSDLKPSRFCDVETLDDEAESREITLKESILRQIYLQTKKQLSINFSTSSTDISKSLSQLTADDTNISKNTLGTLNEEEEISTIVANRRREQMSVAVGGPNRVRFSIWASFAEVYNEQVYDLLVPPPEDATKSRRFRTANGSKPTSTYQGRPTAYQRSTRMKGSSPPHFGRRERVSLQLKEDVQGRPYISGLREVNVTSADEAFKLLTLGRRNLQMAYTKLNESSSRSHCIFTLKLMRVLESRDGSDGIKHTKFNILSLCDLAGIERSCKTQNMGERVKEAGSINNSLFTLSRCIQAIKHNQVSQASDRQLLPPFRESKLTRLFQSFLTGKGRAKMIVTVSQCRSMYPENLNAIKFSAIAKQVSLVPAQVFPIEMPKPVINPVLQKHKLKPRDTIEWATLSEVKKHKTVPLTAKELVEEVVAESDEDDDDDSDGTINEEDGDEESDSSDDLDVEPSKLVKKLRDENDNLKKEKSSLEARIEKMTKDTEAHVKSLHTKYEELLERAELRCEEAMDKKVELLTDAYETALKRRRCDDDDNMATRESMAARIRDLEEDLQTTNQQLVNWKQNYDLSNREVQSLTREITEVKFQAAAERMQVAERSSSIEMENLELKAQLEKMKEKNETMENQYKNEVSNLTRDVSRLEGLNKSLLSDLESQNLLLSSNDGELAKVRSQNLELLVRIKQLEVVLSSQEASDEYCRAACNKSLGLGDTTVNNMDLSHLLNNMSIAGAPNNLEGGTHFIQCHKDEPNMVNTESHEYATETGNSVTNSPESARNESEDEPYSDDSDKDLFSDSLNLVVCEKTPARNDSVEGSNEGRDTLDSTDLHDDATVDYQGDEDDNTRESTAESTEPTSAYTAEQDSLEVKSELDSQKDNVSISYEDDQIKSPSFEEERNQPRNPVTDVRYKSMPYIDQSCSGASEIEKDCLESSDFPDHPSAGHHPPTSFSKFSLSTCPLESSDFESPPVGAQTGREEEARAPSESTDRLDSDESKFVRPGEAAIASLYKSTRKTRTASTTKSVRTSSKTTVKKKFETPHVSSKGRSKPKISDSDENDDEDNNNDSDDDDDFEPTSSVKKAPPKMRKTRQASVRSKRTTVEKEVDEDLEANTKENAYGPKSSKKASQPAADSATTGRKRRNLMKMSDDGPLLSLPLEESHLKDDTSTSPLSSLKRHLRSRKL